MSFPGDLSSNSLPKGYPEVDEPSCQLLGRTALIVQGLMGVLVLLSLIYKRHRESPKRPWRIWLFDVSKQIIGQLFVHSFNILVSGFTSDHTSSNACVSYFLHILIDTTFGIFLIYVILYALTRLFTEKFHLKGFESGVYGNPPAFKYWARQAALYVLALTSMKTVVVTFLYIFPQIYLAGEWLLSWTWTGEGDELQVIFVMGIFPIIMNILQFWLIDTIVKAAAQDNEPADIEHGNYHDREPLFQAPDDDEDSPEIIPNIRTYRRSLSLDSRGLGSPDSLTLATPGDASSLHIHKSTSNSLKNDDGEVHEYPPSLSSSFSSNVSSAHGNKSPREAKNLMKKNKRREPLTPTHHHPESASSSPSPPKPEGEGSTGEWHADWDDSNDWDTPGQRKS